MPAERFDSLFLDPCAFSRAIAAFGRLRGSPVYLGFVLLPRRWVVEHAFAWLNRNRRLAKDVGTTIESWLYIANVKLTSRRLATA